jgi:hypothetical protein
MGFAVSSLVATIAGIALVGTAAFGAGYGAGAVLVTGTFVVSFVGALLAIASFARKEARGLSVFALVIALAPGLFMVGKFVENQYVEYRQDRGLTEGVPGAQLAQPAPYVSVDRETGAVVFTDKPPQ